VRVAGSCGSASKGTLKTLSAKKEKKGGWCCTGTMFMGWIVNRQVNTRKKEEDEGVALSQKMNELR